jgi:L-asparaginase II
VVVLAPDGSERFALGDPDATVWARSSLKPLQAVAMLRAGLDVDGAELALVCASHNAEAAHLDVVRTILAAAHLSADDLRNTPDWPLDADAAWQWRADGHGTEPLTQNCSGKHAGMLATCVAAGWPTQDYLDPSHPLQRATREVVAELTGVPVELATVDGCGAPLFSTTLRGLARSFAGLASGDGLPRRAGRAMAEHPWHVAGTGRDATRFMEAVPGLVAKDGADGVYAAGLPDGGAVALKIVDGSSRPRPVVLAAALAVAGVDPAVVTAVALTPVLGHGRAVGEVVATFGA